MSEDSADARGVTRGTEPEGSADGLLSQLWLDVANKYERYRHLDPEETVLMDWHSRGTVLAHWSMLVLMILTAGTGLLKWIGWYGALDIGIWGGYYVAFLIHVWTGVLFAIWAFVLYPYYSLVVDGKQVIVSADQVKEQIIIGLSMFGLASYIPGYKKARRTYDEEVEEWVGHHPMQTAFWYATWGFAAILTLTGFALWAALSTEPAAYISVLGFVNGWFAFETILRLHLLSTFLFLASVAVHAYIALLPSNRDLLFSMVHGKLNGWRVDEDTRPDPNGGARPKDSLVRSLSGVASLLGTGPELHEHLDASATVTVDGDTTEATDEDSPTDTEEAD